MMSKFHLLVETEGAVGVGSGAALDGMVMWLGSEAIRESG